MFLGEQLYRMKQKKVLQYNLQNNLVSKFESKIQCCEFGLIANKTLLETLNTNTAYDEHYYKYLVSNLSCFTKEATIN
jgi:hypothetical protein